MSQDPLLLDTHAFLWFVGGDPRLPAAAVERIQDEACFVSAASAWEIAIKAALGRLRIGGPLAGWLPEQLELNSFEELPVTIRHAGAVEALPPLHADPFDRLLVAQAASEGLTIVTADPAVRAYGTMWCWDEPGGPPGLPAR